MTTLTHPNGENDVRLELACELIERARGAGHVVLVSEKHFDNNLEAVRRIVRSGATKVYKQMGPTAGADRRHLFFREALNFTDFDGVLWTEEKPYMAEAVDDMIERMRSRGASALIPGRTNESWESWPWLQQYSERIGNRFYNELFGPSEDEPYDPMHGPAYFGREVIGEVLAFDPTKHGLPDVYIQQFVPIVLMSKGVRVASLDIECEYPRDQKREEEGPKLQEMFDRRMGQLKQIVDGHYVLHSTLFTTTATR